MSNFLNKTVYGQAKFEQVSVEKLDAEDLAAIEKVTVFLPQNTERKNSVTGEVFHTGKSLAFNIKGKDGYVLHNLDNAGQQLQVGTVINPEDVSVVTLRHKETGKEVTLVHVD